MAVEIAAGQARVLSEALDYYLHKGAGSIPELYKLSNQETKRADEMVFK